MDETVYEYATLRYVPDVERGEFVNVGLLMMCKRYRWLRTAVRLDERRLMSLFPKADLKLLRSQLGVFERRDVPAADLPVEERYRWMAAVKSAIIQVSASHPGVLPAGDADPMEALDDTFTRLFLCLVT